MISNQERTAMSNNNTTLLTLEEFVEVNDQELTCIFAESGDDREYYFDRYGEIYLLWDNADHFSKQYGALIYYTKENTCNH